MQPLRTAQRKALQQLFSPRPQSFRQLHQSTQPTFRTRTSQPTGVKAFSRASRPSLSPSFRSVRQQTSRTSRRFQSTASASEENLSLSQKLKKLSREYGWAAVGVYLALTAIDLPFCFLTVRLLGTDRIGHWEHVVVTAIKEWIQWPIFGKADDVVEEAADKVEKLVKAPLEDVRDGQKNVLEEDETYVVADHGYKEAEKAASAENANIWTQLVLAYAIHKSFIFLRVPLTAAVTPKVVKTLRGWGWNIGKMPKRTKAVGEKSGVNTRGSGVKPDD